MNRLLLLAATSLAVALALPTAQSPVNQQMVDEINSKNVGWTAKVYPHFAEMSEQQLKKLMGAKHRHEDPTWSDDQLTQVEASSSNEDIPDTFDASEHWSNCKDVITTIADQSACGSCWAVSSASVMSDRLCIGSNGENKTPISSKNVITCCSFCGYGCDGGWPDQAFNFWHRTGVVSGSSFALDQFCQPYPFPECVHGHSRNDTGYPKCQAETYKTPKCSRSCQDSFTTHPYDQDKYKAKSVTKLSRNVAAIQREIMTNGPVVFTFSVYSDFVSYESGVYRHTTGTYLGGHAVRAVGWGEENGTKYWLIANSWNTGWGDKGYFKIIRGVNNCGIEQEVVGGIAAVDSAPTTH